jgi:UrcA family protein
MEVKMKKTSLSIAAALVATALPATAIAQEPTASASIAVRYGDLDLGTAAGRQSLDSRVSAAVRRVCARVVGGGVEDWIDHWRCLREASARALTSTRLAIAQANRDRASGAALAAR